MLYRFSIVFLIGLCLVACSSGSMQEESVPVIRFKPDEEGVQKGKIPPCRIGYLISVSNRDTNKSRVPNTFWTPSSFIAYQTLFRLTILLYIHLNGCRIYSCRIIKSGTTIYHMFESKLYFSLKCFFTIDNQSDFLIQID